MAHTYQDLKGKRVLITGAATGIGRATAIELARHQCKLAINYHSSDEKAKELGGKICQELDQSGCDTLLIQADVSDEKSVMNMFQTIRKTWDGLDVLINNAGIQEKSPSHDLEMESFNTVFNTNAIGTFLCSREALKMFLKQKCKGAIINNTSVHELIPKPFYLSYSMSKGAVKNLTRTLALEYAEYGIRVNSVAPGAISTPINPWAIEEKKKDEIREHIPTREIGTPEQVARVMAFLASEVSDYVTGQTFFVDGGLTLYPDFGEDWSSG